MLTTEQLKALSRDWKRMPLNALAARHGMETLPMIALLRENGIVKDVQPQELTFITENLQRMPHREIRERLKMTETQFAQICQKQLGVKRRKAGTELTLREAVEKTRRLVEEKLKMRGDEDDLPRIISNKHFAEHGLYHCTAFAEQAKQADPLYRQFPAVAFLVCHAYPGTYKPFQFRHAKASTYFTGKEGRQNLLDALQWIVEDKIGIPPEEVATAARSKSFLRDADLQYYGLGSHWWRRQFRSKQEMLDALLDRYSPRQPVPGGTTARLRKTLAAAGRPVERCEADGCDRQRDIAVHHIIPRASRLRTRADLHSADNLVALCPNHHGVAHDFAAEDLDPRRPETWRPKLLAFLQEAG